METLYHAHDISLTSNAFGFLRFPLNFEPHNSEADVIITGVPLIWQLLADQAHALVLM